MRIARRWVVGGAAGLSMGCVALTGCQTYPAGFGGMTLPSPHYLKHYPQYFPEEPAFPLQRELDSMQNPDVLGRQPGPRVGVAPLPPVGQIPPPAPMADDGQPIGPGGL